MAVRVVAETVDLDKLKDSQELKDVGLTIGNKLQLRPRLLIRNVPSNIEPKNLTDEICNRNLNSIPADEIKTIFVYLQIRDRSNRNIVIEVSPAARNQIMSRSRLYIGYGSCRVEDHIRILRCYKCVKHGHTAK
ncbi:hypothetical protein WH47_10764 [Habropoda laboriosa]|uniref:Pre-C2HC domain-containing protein n=1 Tax=Habropoda laboriosa TaxID=597456 RepID=A0A0L7QMN3_9HYME|nr:hypothetical protein WH47_10764 [Habropoda laboriosa]